MSAYPPPQSPSSQGYPPQGGVPPYGQPPQYPPPLPGQPGYQWGSGPAPFAFAGFGSRLGALLLDSLILGVPIGIVYAIGFGLLFAGSGTTLNATGETVAGTPNGAVIALGGVLILIVVLFALLYEPLLTARKGPHNGQTFGKQILGIRIVTLGGGPIGGGTAWVRFLVKNILSSAVFYLGFLWALWDTNQQTWHDKIANTVVVRA